MFDDATLIFVPVIPLSLFFNSFFPSNYWLISSTRIFAGVRTVLYALGHVHTKTLNTTLRSAEPRGLDDNSKSGESFMMFRLQPF